MLLLTFLLSVSGALLISTLAFTYESACEQQIRARKVGAFGIAACCLLFLLILAWPQSRPALAVMFGLGLALFAVFLVPGASNRRALDGAKGYVVEKFTKADERDIVFARNRSLRPDSEQYRLYYEQLHPEREERDSRRRAIGGALGGEIGSIDGWRPLSAMVSAIDETGDLLAAHAEKRPSPEAPPAELDPAKATEIIKGLAKHLGAVKVGVCRVDPRWAYSHRGETHFGKWDDWGEEIDADLPYAVVIVTEMDHELVGASPHTPTTVESTANYALGMYITTILAQWFASMGHRGEANHLRHYTHNMVPLALDAGLGELGRFGYLVNDEVGARGRLAACFTDMPLVADAPVDLGVEAFCENCEKCADSCPSRSIPKGEKSIDSGRLLWKIKAESCFDYWGKIGTDCSICMSVCPFSRPNRSVHKMVRWMLRRSPLAQRFFPYVDNFIYGKRWKPRRTYSWADYPRRRGAVETPETDGVDTSSNGKTA